MKKNLSFFLILMAVTALIVSCASKPPAATPATPATTAPTAGQSARADEARRKAMDFQSPEYFPSEWEALEAQYAAASNATEYNTVAAGYNELFNKTIPLYAQAREDEIMSAREELIASGLMEYYPQFLKDADDIALSAKSQYEAGDYYPARDTAARALKEYENLLVGARVYLSREEIINRGFLKYDPENFARADEVGQTAVEQYEAGNKDGALASLEEAQLRYNIVLANGWTIYSAERREIAAAERQLAVADKANIAVRDTFREGDALFNQAEESYAAEKFQEAAYLYIDSEAIFAVSRQETEEKRRLAEEAIRLAEEIIEESNETAIEAERIIEGGSK
ncbi:MAG: hypothetical protein LBI28_03420 [Treponema sp.]|jgi:hypothetical protein|nr:hypothetical protein [Treponema sp.]